MGLTEYKKKRKFNETPEPSGKVVNTRSKLKFVIQKHEASHLHYDFRLEMEGVLKSWAVPKGPSLNPEDKRLAMAVEDHPMDYRTFEGIIPEGNYGAGTVMVWDEGTYYAEKGLTKAENEKKLLAGLHKGKITFTLEGEKLRGEFALVKIRGGSRDPKGNSWLLIKHEDEFVETGDIREQDHSVKTKRSMQEIETDGDLTWVSNRAKKGEQSSDEEAPKKTGAQKTPKGKKAPTAAKTKAAPAEKPVKKEKGATYFSPEAPQVSKEKQYQIGKHTVTISNPKKVLFPDSGYTKQDLVEYYRSVADYILPYLKDRPFVMNRFPHGITDENFYQKDVTGTVPEYVETIPIFSESNDKDINYLICQNEQTLVYLANLACIETHAWNSRKQNLHNADYMAIDLDPEDIGFEKVIEAAHVVKQVLDEVGAKSYCKTSGATGLHIYVPLGAKYDYDIVREFGHLVAVMVNQRIPHFTSLERSPKKRQKKIYLDYLQNRFGQTLVTPYSVRPREGAPVSTPLHWEEVKKGLNPAAFTIKNILARIEKEGDLWKPALGKGIDLKACLTHIQEELA